MDPIIEALRVLAENQVKSDQSILDVVKQLVERVVAQDERITVLELILIKEGTMK